jgi:hypothetical protein
MSSGLSPKVVAQVSQLLVGLSGGLTDDVVFCLGVAQWVGAGVYHSQVRLGYEARTTEPMVGYIPPGESSLFQGGL